MVKYLAYTEGLAVRFCYPPEKKRGFSILGCIISFYADRFFLNGLGPLLHVGFKSCITLG